MNHFETLYTTTLRDLDKKYLLQQDNHFFQSGLGDTGEISLEVGDGHGYKKKVTIIVTRSKKQIFFVKVFKLLLRYAHITKCEI